MSQPSWLPEGATKYRETTDFCIWTQARLTTFNIEVRTVRREQHKIRAECAAIIRNIELYD